MAERQELMSAQKSETSSRKSELRHKRSEQIASLHHSKQEKSSERHEAHTLTDDTQAFSTNTTVQQSVSYHHQRVSAEAREWQEKAHKQKTHVESFAQAETPHSLRVRANCILWVLLKGGKKLNIFLLFLD